MPRPARTAVAVVAAVAVALGAGFAIRSLTAGRCGSSVDLNVAAAPAIAPAIRDAADRWTADDRHGGRCVRVTVSAADPADVAGAIARKLGGGLEVLSGETGAPAVPHVWIPDSSSWLIRLRGVKRDAVADNTPSLAVSPVVLAVHEPAARALGWPKRQIGWADVLGTQRSQRPVRIGVVEPRRSAAGLSGLLAASQAASAGAAARRQDGETAVLGAYRAMAVNRAFDIDALLTRFPANAGPSTLATSIGAAPLPEQVVAAYNAKKPAVPLVALYPEHPGPALDFPYATLTGISAARADAAKQFRRALTGLGYRELVAARGLRAADGIPGQGFRTGHGVTDRPAPSAAPVNADMVTRALGAWAEVSISSRILAVIDVSGSMLRPVPTAGNRTRMEVTLRAAGEGLRLFTDDSDAGLWIFSTNLDGAKDYRELVPIGPLAAQRQQLTDALGGVQAKPDGDTGLYDTVRAAYESMKRQFDPKKSNSIVLFTDGRNEDRQGLSLQQLLRELDRLSEPAKPIRLIAIGVGPEADFRELSTVAKATGGAAFVATDPSKIGEIFLRGLAVPSCPTAPC